MQNPARYIWQRKWLLALVILGVIVVVWVAAAASRKPNYQFVSVKRGPITETVTVTGNTTSSRNASLAFQTSGVIASVQATIGSYVAAGQVIASLDTSDLRAQLTQAQAAVDAQQAQLDKLLAGPRSEDIAVSRTGLTVAQQNLTNTYAGVLNTLADADTKTADAVVNQLALFFTNAQTSNPQFTFSISDSQLMNNIQSQRVLAGIELTNWQAELGQPNATLSPSALDTLLQNAQNHVGVAKILLGQAAQAVVDSTSLSATTITTYKTNVTTGLTEVNQAATEITTAIQTIAAEKAAVAQAQAQLNLTSASSTSQDVDAQHAQVEQAQANVQSVQAKIRQASLIAPIDGIVTQQNAKIGQTASPGAPLATILGTGGFEVDAYLPEVDIGKIAVGDPASITFDAFPGETFQGNIFYVNPAETIVSGVVDYLVKISFAKADPRIKSGLTTNCTISTKTDNNVLLLPQYAILQNDQGTFVKALQDGKVTQLPVQLGIQDNSGNVEVLSGVSEGQQVINIGLK